MVKVPVPLTQIMRNPYLSITTSPFTKDPEKMIIKKASFKKGEIPDHLKDKVITPGEGNNPCTRENGITGTVMYKGRLIPKAALCLAYLAGKPNVREEIKSKYPRLAEKFEKLEEKFKRGVNKT